MPNLDDIIWAAISSRDPIILPEALKGNQAYLGIIGNEGFLEGLRYNPQDLDINEVRNILVGFLNKWGCRLRNYDNVTASNLKNCILEAHPQLRAVQNYSILDFNFEVLISERLNINPPHSLVKFVDEFNWLAYKRKITRPHDWICPFE